MFFLGRTQEEKSEQFLTGSCLVGIYFIFKCGLHYLAMLKLFQRIVFACLTKSFCTFKLYRILQWLRFFSDFPLRIQCFFFTEFKISSPIVDAARIPTEVEILAFNYECPNLLVYEIRRFLCF